MRAINLLIPVRRERRRAQAHSWYLKNRELTISRTRQWRADNPERHQNSESRRYLEQREERIAAAVRWNRENPKRRREIRRKWKRENHAQVLAEQRQRRQKNPDRHRMAVREWQAAHPEQVKTWKLLRRARERGAITGEHFSHEEIAERDGWRCHICDRKVTRANWSLDHLVPLSYGGEHTRANVALAHHGCNASRGNRGTAQLLLVG